MNYGFLINNDTCIGCHACSTACKSENEVPLGVQRTWVKSVETGVYPNVRRSFQVTRCNHCANPPCVRICPVTAMYQREDGIVEFDPDVCIGCKACMQACPYDAIYVDPETGSVAKCHYCAHRVEVGLEPACVVVCPEHAIVSGDLDDPDSEIAGLVAANKVTVRKPEQGTAPKLFYIGGADSAQHPTATERTPRTFAWADVVPLHGDGSPDPGQPRPDGPRVRPSAPSSSRSASGTPIRRPAAQGLPEAGPIMIGEGRMAEQMVQVVYNAQHKVPWHWPVPAYLVTKAVAAGLFMLLAVGHFLGLLTLSGPQATLAGGVIVAMALATTILLIYDLEHPARFLRIVLRPQWKSWLVRGAFLLIGFSTLAGLWWVAEAAATLGWLDPSFVSAVRPWAFGVGVPFALGAAVYTAFLFGQAEGRDLWQSGLLPIHLTVQALMAGAAALLLTGVAVGGAAMVPLARVTLMAMLALDLVVVVFGELMMPHASEAAAQAAHAITSGRYARLFWVGAVLVGHLVPLILLAAPIGPAAGAIAALLTLAGLYAYEHAYVMAPQDVPNS